MLKPVLNRNSALACNADCHSDNQTRPLALFLYEMLCVSVKTRPANCTFGFADTKANAEKTERAVFFANARTK